MRHNYEYGTDADYYNNEVDSDYDGPSSKSCEDDLCTNCNGSGEGMYDGSRCYICKGKGTVPTLTEDD